MKGGLVTLSLRDDQVADLAFALSQPKVLYLHDPGTGKTPPVCVNQWRRATEGRRTIWTQPKCLMLKNAEELKRFTPFTDKDIAIVDGTRAQIDRAMNSGAQVLLMGPDRFKRIHHLLPDDMAHDVDEFHMCFGGAGSGFNGFQSVPSARVEAYYAYNERCPEGIGMTGTLINGRLDTAFPAIHAIDKGYYPFGYEQFLGAHAYLDERGKPYAWRDHERIAQILGIHGIRRTFADVYGEQEVVKELQLVEMHPKQREVYDRFEAEAYLELEKFMIDGTMPGVAFIRARQIMEHPNQFKDLRDPDGKLKLPPVDIMPGVRPAKLEALEIHLEDHNRRGTPVIIFAALIPQLQQIAALAESMGRRVGLMYGETSSRRKNEIDLGFQAGELDTIVASPPVASVGFNWQFCGETEVDHVIFASVTPMDSDFIQGYRRAIRRKRSKPLRVTTMEYFRSVDRRFMEILEIKSADAHKVDPTRELLRFSSHEEVLA